MRLTVLGSGAACPPAGGASSGYLVEAGGSRILLDCGTGVAAALLARLPDCGIDAVLISHMHADHFVDLLPLRFRLCRDLCGPDSRRVRLLLPPGGREVLAGFLAAVCFPPDFIENTFIVEQYEAGGRADLGGLRAEFAAGVLYVPAFAARLDDGSRSLAYTGDTAPSAGVEALAAGASVLLAEATLDQPETTEVRGHMTPAQAAEMALAAGVERLYLTHFWFDADRERACRDAAAVFPRTASVRDGMTIDI